LNIFSNDGKFHSESTKEKLKFAWEKRLSNPNFVSPWLGRKHSKESIEKMRKAHILQHAKRKELNGKFSEKSINS
jgi:hypothetical protein